MDDITNKKMRDETGLLQAIKKAAFDLNTNPEILENILVELVSHRNKIVNLEKRIAKLSKEEINKY